MYATEEVLDIEVFDNNREKQTGKTILLTLRKNTSDRRGKVGTEYQKTYNSHNTASSEHP